MVLADPAVTLFAACSSALLWYDRIADGYSASRRDLGVNAQVAMAFQTAQRGGDGHVPFCGGGVHVRRIAPLGAGEDLDFCLAYGQGPLNPVKFRPGG